MAAASLPESFELKEGVSYDFWKAKMEALFLKLDLEEILTTDCPPEGDQRKEAWKKKDRLLKAEIVMRVDQMNCKLIMNCSSGKEAWRKLKETYSAAGMEINSLLFRKLVTMRLAENESMISHISEFHAIRNKLETNNINLPDDLMKEIILNSLPSSYKSIVDLIRLHENITFKNVISRLQTFKLESEDKNEISLSRVQKKEIACYGCGEKGHIKKNCRKAHEKAYKNMQKADKFNVKTKKDAKGEVLCIRDKSLMKLTTDELQNTNKFVLDSGASSQYICNKSLFNELNEDYKSQICIADGSTLNISGKGTLSLECKISAKESKVITLQEAYYAPNLDANYISLCYLIEKGCKAVFENDLCTVTRDGRTLLKAKRTENNLLEVICRPKSLAKLSHCMHKNSLELWHKRLGHRDVNVIKTMSKEDLAQGLSICNCKDLQDNFCKCCIQAKGTRCSFPAKNFPAQNPGPASQPLDLIVSDLCGALPQKTAGGKRYFVTFTDMFSKFSSVYLLAEKREVLQRFQEYCAFVENKFNRKIKRFRSDNGGEYANREFEAYLKGKGIVHEKTVSYCPEQNSIAERKNRSLLEMVRCLLLESNLPDLMWGEALQVATYLQNRLLTKGIASNQTPYELWNGRKPSLFHLKVFGCKAYAYIPKQKRNKLNCRTQLGIMLGYAIGTKGYRIWDPQTGSVKICNVVYFSEKERISLEELKCFKRGNNWTYTAENWEFPNENTLINNDCTHTQSEGANDNTNQLESEGVVNNDFGKTPQIPNNDTDSKLRRSDRDNKGKPPQRFCCTTKHENNSDPRTWNEVLKLPSAEADKWRSAAIEEMDSLRKNQTWTLQELPKGKKAIGCKWVFKTKYDEFGKIQRYKARLVAKGYTQKFGEDYDEIFAPVVRHTTIRLLLSVAAIKGMHVQHLDVKTAFLHGELKEVIYMEQPKGFIEPGREGLVCKLQKSIYGLKQAARAWSQKLNQMLTNMGFCQGEGDTCLYTRMNNNKCVYILCYVDDLIICTQDKGDIHEIIEGLNKEVEVKNLGNASHYLGTQITKDKYGNYFMNQKQKIIDLIKFLGLCDANESTTPMEVGYMTGGGNQEKLESNGDYRTAIGKLLYIMTVSRPDIANAVSLLSRKVSEPTQEDWTAVKRLGRYLKGTMNFNLKIPASQNAKLIGYTDSDWARCRIDRKSTSGYVFLYGGAPVTWCSKKQTITALSSTEAEYCAAEQACRELAWLHKLFNDFKLKIEAPTILNEDNTGCIKTSESNQIKPNMKHIDVKLHFVRDMQEKGHVKLVYCCTDEMVADILTKPLPKERFLKLRDSLGLIGTQTH